MADDIGFVAMVLLFGMSFALYLGAGDTFGSPFIQLITALGSGGTMDFTWMINTFILIPLTDPLVIAVIGAAAAAGFVVGGGVKYGIGAAVASGIATVFFIPFTAVTGIPVIPIEVSYLIRGFFALILIIAIMGFITEKRF